MNRLIFENMLVRYEIHTNCTNALHEGMPYSYIPSGMYRSAENALKAAYLAYSYIPLGMYRSVEKQASATSCIPSGMQPIINQYNK